MRKRVAEGCDLRVIVEQERKKRGAVVRRADDEHNPQLLRRSGFRHASRLAATIRLESYFRQASVSGVVSPLTWPCTIVTGPTEETPCVQTGLSAAAVVTTTIATRAPTTTSRSSLATRRPATTADPDTAVLTILITPAA
jgi:hypothetical protein